MTYDVVWFWVGGTEAGEWRPARVGKHWNPAQEMVAHLRKMGYVAKRGLASIGPPEGPPTAAELRGVLGQ